MANRLEVILNKEIAVLDPSSPFSKTGLKQRPHSIPVHHNVIAQPEFPFLPLIEKDREIEKYKEEASKL